MDRFGLSVDVLSSTDIDERIEVIKRRDAYENDHEAFIAHWQSEDATCGRALLPRAQLWQICKLPIAPCAASLSFASPWVRMGCAGS